MFAIRHELLKLLGNDITAYNIAQDFVKDDAEKLEVFKDAYAEGGQPINSHPSNAPDVQAVTSIACDKAEQRWKALNPA